MYSNGQIYGGDFEKFCGLLRIYEIYVLQDQETDWVSSECITRDHDTQMNQENNIDTNFCKST